MAEATKERTAERTAEQAFQRAEDTIGSIFENNRRTVQSLMEFNRNTVSTGYELARNLQEEGLRFGEAWLDQVTRLQKSYFKSIHDYTNRFQDYTEKVVRDNQDRWEETLDQGMDVITPATVGSRHKRR